jgi:hypothetical protein
LQDLDKDISEEEIHGTIKEITSEKAPGSDGYIDGFFKVCWDIVKLDIVNDINENFALGGGCWNLLNSADVVLIEKKEGATAIGDYRPISIMHSMVKLLAKILANRLAPHLDRLVSHSLSAFIKGRSIHDNFQYIKGGTNHFHHVKTPMLLLKLDITNAFDSV